MSFDYLDPNNSDFVDTGRRITWKDDGKRSHWSKLYKPSRDAVQWDIPDFIDDYANIFAFGSRHECFCYVILKITGRTIRSIPDCLEYTPGVTVRVVGQLQPNWEGKTETQKWSGTITTLNSMGEETIQDVNLDRTEDNWTEMLPA